MKILYFFKKLFCLIKHISNTSRLFKGSLKNIAEFANHTEADIIRRWFKKIVECSGVKVSVDGEKPNKTCLIISNHISWLDIVIIGGIFETTFLSKSEVSKWPIIGSITRFADVIFIKRGTKDASEKAIKSLNRCLKYGRNVTIFPEGTTSDGNEILKFKPRLFASVINDNIPIQCVSISYPDKNNKTHKSVPFVRNDSLFLNILKVLFSKNIKAKVTIGKIIYPDNMDRRSLSDICYEEIKNNKN
ncbi:MAG: hypothetical protein CMD90_01865 [Gammaproteobacteria bacterium]|nr:hypothetical protein [Gammaproteobacteria bacterium]|tara:strand:- start:4992 stop:5729 length:738 start_codon:yes stop_codon:yes gene_type:complete